VDLHTLRSAYHSQICQRIIRLKKDGEEIYPNFADKGSSSSRTIALGIVERLNCRSSYKYIAGQRVGRLFETITKDFLENAFDLLAHLRPGKWYYSMQSPISDFDQYRHLRIFKDIVAQTDELASSLGTDLSSNLTLSWPADPSLIKR